MKVSAIATSLVLVLTVGVLTTVHTPFASATSQITSPLTPDFFNIESNNGSGYIVCNPTCHLSSNSDNTNSGSSGSSGSSDTGSSGQPAYRLTVNVPSHPFGTSTVGMSITTENGYTDQANVPTAGGTSYTFNIPANQGNSVKVCVKPENLSVNNCHKYETTGSDMSVSLPAGSTSYARHIGPWNGWGEYSAFPGFYGYP